MLLVVLTLEVTLSTVAQTQLNQRPGTTIGIDVRELAITSQNKVVYRAIEDRNNIEDLYAVNLDGSGHVRLSSSISSSERVQDFKVSEDGSKVVFTTATNNTPASIALYSIDIAGGTPIRIDGLPFLSSVGLRGSTMNPRGYEISSDASRVIYLSDQLITNKSELLSVPIDGSAAPIRLNVDIGTSNDGINRVNGFRLLPNSSEVLYSVALGTGLAENIYRVPILGGTSTSVTQNINTSGDILSFAVSSNGLTVALVGDLTTNNNFGIFTVPSDASSSPNEIVASDVNITTFAFSPDGSRILYQAFSNQLFTIPTAGGTPARLNDINMSGTTNTSLFPQFSPDGLKVLYTWDAEVLGRRSLYRVPVDGGTVTRIDGVFSSIFNFNTAGDAVVYLSQATNNKTEVFQASLNGGFPRRINIPILNDQDVFAFDLGSVGNDIIYTTNRLNTFGTSRDLFRLDVTTIDFLNPTVSYFTDFDITKATFTGKKLEGLTNIQGIRFDPTGTKLFVLNGTANTITQYDLSEAYNLSTAVVSATSWTVSGVANVDPADFGFSIDGTRLYVLNDAFSAQRILEYHLPIPFDLSNPTILVNGLDRGIDISSDFDAARGLDFTRNQGKYYVTGGASSNVVEYAGSGIPMQLESGASPRRTDAFEATSARGIAIHPSGEKLYILDASASLYEYNLPFFTTRLNFTDNQISFVDQTGAFAQEVIIDPTGSRMYVGNSSGIFEYQSSQFMEAPLGDGSVIGEMTIVLDRVLFAKTGELVPGIDYSINNLPAGLTSVLTVAAGKALATLSFTGSATDGTDANDISSISVTFRDSAFDGAIASEVDNAVNASTRIGIDFIDKDPVFTSVGTGFDVSRGTYAGLNEDLTIENTDVDVPFDIAFSNDGMKMYVPDATGNTVAQYQMTQPYDVSTGAFEKKISVAGRATFPTGVAISPDGSKLFVTGSNAVASYDLSNSFDIGTAVFNQLLSVTSSTSNPESITFNTNGTKMFLISKSDFNPRVAEYALTTAFDVSTASLSTSFSVGSQVLDPKGITFDEDGTNMFVVGSNKDLVAEYHLATAFDVSSARYAGAIEDLLVGSQEGNPEGLAFNTEGTKLFVIGQSGVGVVEYDLPTSVSYMEETLMSVVDIDANNDSGGGNDVSVIYSLSGADAAQFEINNVGVVTFVSAPDFDVPADNDMDNVYEVGVVAANGASQVTQPVFVRILSNSTPPTIAADQTFSVDESSPAGTVVGTVVASDVEGDALTYAIASGNFGNAFAVDANTGEITVNDPFQINTLFFTRFDLVVEVSDAKVRPVTGTVVINVTKSTTNEQPNISGQVFTIDENSAFGVSVGTVVASDPDGDVLAYGVIAGNISEAFAINESSGELTVSNSSALDFETTPSFSLTVQVSDGKGGVASAMITINLTDVDEASNIPPTISDQTFSIAENSVFATVVGTVAASDADGDALTFSITNGNTGEAFSIHSSTGELTVNTSNVLNFETTPSFALTIEVNDGKGGLANATVTVILTDVDETNNTAPTISDQTFNIAENAASATVVGTVAANDADGDALTFSITSGNIGGAFSIDSGTGELSVSTSGALDFETTPSFSLTMEVNDGRSGIANATVTVNLTDMDEVAPTFTSPSMTSFSENSTEIVYAITTNESSSFSLGSSKDEALFSLSNDNEISFVSAPDFEDPKDADTNNSYVVDITATDEADNSSILELTINVIDVDDNVLGVVTTDFEGLTFYPNPVTNGHVKVDLGDVIKGEIRLVSSNGRVVLTRTINDREIYLDLSKEASGMYIFEVVSGQGNKALVRLIKN